MKKITLLIALIAGTAFGYAQKDKEVQLNRDTNLIEATYYHDNGEISQKGTFDLAGKLHGEWVSFNENGEKISMGSYVNGAKTGKWFFWTEGILKEVEFSNNAIASVINRENATRVVDKD